MSVCFPKKSPLLKEKAFSRMLPDQALSTFPERRQEVHTYILFVWPFCLTLTDLMFGFQTLFDLLCEWLTAFPKWTLLSHTEHFATFKAPPYLSPFTTHFSHGKDYIRLYFIWQVYFLKFFIQFSFFRSCCPALHWWFSERIRYLPCDSSRFPHFPLLYNT